MSTLLAVLLALVLAFAGDQRTQEFFEHLDLGPAVEKAERLRDQAAAEIAELRKQYDTVKAALDRLQRPEPKPLPVVEQRGV